MVILYDNDDIIVAIKPFGVKSESDEKGGMPELLKKETGAREIYTVHRLDTVTTGVMVYAKTKAAAAVLTKQINDGIFKKTYLALVHGTVEPEKGRMEDWLFKDSRKNKSFTVKKERKGVKKAILDYEVLKTENSLSLVKILLLTGRTHQIRVQFSSRKHPVFGDGKYGASDNVPYIALHSHKISFLNPRDGKEMTFSSEPEWSLNQ